MDKIDTSYGHIIQIMNAACKKAGGKVSLLMFLAGLPCEGVRVTPNHLCELFQRGEFIYADGYFWPASMDNCGCTNSEKLLTEMLSKLDSNLSIEMLFRTTPVGLIPANLKFQFAKHYYGLTTEETLDVYVEYLDHVAQDQLGNYDSQAYRYYLNELFGESVTEKHIDVVRLSVKMEAKRKQRERTELLERRDRLTHDLAQINHQLENYPDA